MVFYAAFNGISPVLGWALMCLAQGHSHRKKNKYPALFEPRTHGLRVKHFITEPLEKEQTNADNRVTTIP